MYKVKVINGPNLNLLGKREPDIYARQTLEEINDLLKEKASQEKAAIDFYQSNHEGDIVDEIQRSLDDCDLIIINPAAYTHTSVAIRDALAAADIPVIEVHLSNIYKREEFRHHSYIAPVACGQISGFGGYGYVLALQAGLQILREKKKK